MKYLILAILFVLLLSCHNNKNEDKIIHKQIVHDTIVYGFINSLLENKVIDELQSSNILSLATSQIYTKQDSSSLSEINDLISKEDLEFINKQVECSKYFELNPNYIKSRVILPVDTIMSLFLPNRDRYVLDSSWNNYHKKYGEKGFCSITMPLFSRNHKLAFIKTGYSCGSLCGYGGTYILIKKKNKWTILKQIENWVS